MTVPAKGNYGAAPEKGIPRGQSLRYSELAKGIYLNRALARVTSIPIIYIALLPYFRVATSHYGNDTALPRSWRNSDARSMISAAEG